ncbi:hypothetical protein FQA39_LY11052 [Lamprigera yunnana]|nr:hypothetical protein FQA39_LY11052 [Lamprigera yunnana]
MQYRCGDNTCSSDNIMEQNIVTVPPLEYVPDPRGVGYFFYDSMIKHRNKIAQIDGVTGEKDTYGELLKRCIRTAIFLQDLGLKPGDFVSICTFNHTNSCTPLIASFFINVITSAIDPTISLESTVYLLKQTKPKVIFVNMESLEMIESAFKIIGIDVTIVIFGDTNNHISFNDVLVPYPEEELFKPTPVPSLDTVALLVFSSGSSGLPKGICHRHYSIMCQIMNNVNSGFDFKLNFGYYSVYWTVFVQCLGTSILTGSTRYFVPKFDVANPWEAFHTNFTYIIINVFQASTLCLTPKPPDVNLNNVENVMITGGVIMSDQLTTFKNIFNRSKVYLLYGQSEVIGYLTHFTPKTYHLQLSKPTSVGLAVPGVAFRVRDIDTGAILGPNQKGELLIKTNYQLIGYYNVDSSEIWDSEGWLKTGDIVYYDDDSCLYVVDRIKEMFKYQGWHIPPASIEAILLQHPSVASAIVIGVPHSHDGHRAMGLVTLKPNTNITAKAIEEFVNDKVEDRLKLTGGLKIINKMPLTPSGKIDRRKIKSFYLDV